MSLWEKIQFFALHLKHVICKNYAEAEIPIQIRHHAAEWLEENLRPSIQKPDEKETGEIVSQLTEEIRMRGRELGQNWESFAGCRLQTMASDLEKQDPMKVYEKIEACILEEMKIIRENPNQICDEKVRNHFENKRKVKKSPQETLISKVAQNVCENRWSWIYVIDGVLPLKNEKDLSAVAMETLKELEDLVSHFCREILTVLKLGGAKDFLGGNVEKLFSDIWKMILELVEFWQIQNESKILTSILTKLEHLKFCLLENSLFCHQSPPQIISQGTKISTAIKFFRGSSNSAELFNPTGKLDIHVKLVTENQAAALFKTGVNRTVFESFSKNFENVGEFFFAKIKDLEISFKDLSLDALEGPKNSSHILDKKHRLIFHTNSNSNEEKMTKVWCLSAPFFIISSKAEECAAHCTIFWDNCLSSTRSYSNSFVMAESPNEVSWSTVRENLSKFFNDQTRTKKPLTMENLNYLGRKLVGKRDLHPDSLISKEMLFDLEQNTNFNFWDWFYSAVELTRKHLREFWDDGEILGFVEVEKARKKFLAEGNPGEFLMCFSEKEPGAISVSVIHSQGRSKKFLRTFNPFRESQLERRSLAERIKIISRGMSRVCFSDSDSDLNSDEDLPKPRTRKSPHILTSDCSSEPKMSRSFSEVEFQVSIHSQTPVK